MQHSAADRRHLRSTSDVSLLHSPRGDAASPVPRGCSPLAGQTRFVATRPSQTSAGPRIAVLGPGRQRQGPQGPQGPQGQLQATVYGADGTYRTVAVPEGCDVAELCAACERKFRAGPGWSLWAAGPREGQRELLSCEARVSDVLQRISAANSRLLYIKQEPCVPCAEFRLDEGEQFLEKYTSLCSELTRVCGSLGDSIGHAFEEHTTALLSSELKLSKAAEQRHMVLSEMAEKAALLLLLKEDAKFDETYRALTAVRQELQCGLPRREQQQSSDYCAVVTAVLHAMHSHSAHAQVQQACMDVLRDAAALKPADSTAVQVFSALQHEDVVASVLCSLEAFREVDELQQSGCDALAAALQGEQALPEPCLSRVVERALFALGVPRARAAALRVLAQAHRHLADAADGSLTPQVRSVLSSAINATREGLESRELQLASSRALPAVVLCTQARAAYAVRECALVPVALQAMLRWPDDEELQRNGCALLGDLLLLADAELAEPVYAAALGALRAFFSRSGSENSGLRCLGRFCAFSAAQRPFHELPAVCACGTSVCDWAAVELCLRAVAATGRRGGSAEAVVEQSLRLAGRSPTAHHLERASKLVADCALLGARSTDLLLRCCGAWRSLLVLGAFDVRHVLGALAKLLPAHSSGGSDGRVFVLELECLQLLLQAQAPALDQRVLFALVRALGAFLARSSAPAGPAALALDVLGLVCERTDAAHEAAPALADTLLARLACGPEGPAAVLRALARVSRGGQNAAQAVRRAGGLRAAVERVRRCPGDAALLGGALALLGALVSVDGQLQRGGLMELLALGAFEVLAQVVRANAASKSIVHEGAKILTLLYFAKKRWASSAAH
eukprot:m51a1_g5346 hypothetical protein (855) ;mRNA; r:450466-454794